MEGTKANLDSPQGALQWCAEECMERGWRLAYSLLHNSSDAQDAVQQAFLVAARKPGRIPLDDPWPWFATVIALEARNVRRKFQRRQVSLREGDTPVPESKDSEPRQELEERELARRVHAELERLPEDEREALVLTQLGGMTYAQAAAALKVPLGTLNHRVSRGLAGLRRRLSTSDATILSCLPVLPVTSPPSGLRAFLDARLGAGASGSVVPATIMIAGVTMKKSLVLLALLVLVLVAAVSTVAVSVVVDDTGEGSGTADAADTNGKATAPSSAEGAPKDAGHANRRVPRADSTTAEPRDESPPTPDETGKPQPVDEELAKGETSSRNRPLDKLPPLIVDQDQPLDPRIMMSIGIDTPWVSKDKPEHILVSPDDSFLVIAGDKFVQRMEADTGRTHWSASLADGDVAGIALSPDGTQLAVATNYTHLVLLDSSSGALTRSIDAGFSISSVAFSNDGSRVLLGSRSSLKCIELESLELVMEESFLLSSSGYPYAEVSPVQFSNDDSKILAASLSRGAGLNVESPSGRLRVFDAESGHTIVEIGADHEELDIQDSVAFTPDGKRAIAVAIDREGYVMSYEEFCWDNPAQIPAGTSAEEAEAVMQKHFASLEKAYKEYLISKGYTEPPAGGSTKAFAAVINLESRAVERRLFFDDVNERTLRVWVSSDSSSLVAWDGKRVHIHDCTTWAHRAATELPTSTRALAFNSSGDVFYCNDGFRIRRFRVSDGAEIVASGVPSLKPDGECLALSPDGSLLVFSDTQGLVAYDVSSQRVRWTRPDTNPAGGDNSFTADGTGLYAFERDTRRPLILDAYTGELKRELEWPEGISGVGRLVVSGDGRVCAATGTGSGSELEDRVALWRESDNYTPVLFFVSASLNESGISSAMLGEPVLSHDGKYGVTPAWKGYMLWNFETGRASVIQRAGGFSNNMQLSFTPDGSEFIAISLGTKRGYTRVSIETGKETNVDVSSLLEDRKAAFNGMLAAPDGKTLLLAPYDWHAVPTLYRVDLKTGALKDKYPAHTRTVEQIVQSRDGSIVSSISEDGVIHVWRMR